MFNLQITRTMADELAALAMKQGQKLSAYIKAVLAAHIAKEQHTNEVSEAIKTKQPH